MLAREHRLRSSDEIREVIKTGKRCSNSFATLHYLESSTPKFAVVTSKALGNAVKRNLIRRRTKAVLAENLNLAPQIAGVFRIKPAAQGMSFQEISRLTLELFGRVK